MYNYVSKFKYYIILNVLRFNYHSATAAAAAAAATAAAVAAATKRRYQDFDRNCGQRVIDVYRGRVLVSRRQRSNKAERVFVAARWGDHVKRTPRTHQQLTTAAVQRVPLSRSSTPSTRQPPSWCLVSYSLNVYYSFGWNKLLNLLTLLAVFLCII